MEQRAYSTPLYLQTALVELLVISRSTQALSTLMVTAYNAVAVIPFP